MSETKAGGKPRGQLKKRGLEVGMKVVSKVLEDPERAKAVFDVIGKVQRGKAKLDVTTHRLRNAGHMPSREDIDRISRHVGALRREVRRLKTRVEGLRRKVEQG